MWENQLASHYETIKSSISYSDTLYQSENFYLYRYLGKFSLVNKLEDIPISAFVLVKKYKLFY